MTSSESEPTARRRVRRRKRCQGGCGSPVVPFLIFIAFFLNFVFADVARISHRYHTIVTPPDKTFLAWIVIYILEFVFVIYQLFYPKPRCSSLIQTKIALPFIFHQVFTAAWLIIFSNEKIFASAILLTVIWLLALVIFSLITHEFRSGNYKHYSFADYCFIEVPFAVLLGWETIAMLLGWNVLLVRLQRIEIISAELGVTAQLSAAIATLIIIVTAAILLAGLPLLMDPFIHLPIIWATFMLGYRGYTNVPKTNSPEVTWASDEIQRGIEWTSLFVCALVTLFFVAAAIILASSRFCIPEKQTVLTSDEPSPSESTIQSRSPRTARSALSMERI